MRVWPEVALLLKHEEIISLLPIGDAVPAVEAGFREQAEGQVRLPTRLTTDNAAGWLRLMPAALEGSDLLGFKVMHSTRGVGVRYMVALYRLSSGELLALLDAEWLTLARTAATTAVAAARLAIPGPVRLGMLGSGEQARAHLEALAAVLPIRHARAFSPSPEHRRDFAHEIGGRFGFPVDAADSAEEALADADVVVLALRAGREPVFAARQLRPGLTVCGISSVRPESREIEDEVWARSDVVVVDDREHVLESGDGRSALAAGSLRPEGVRELRELVGGRAPGRTRDDQVALFKSVGTALQDLALAAAVYRLARERGVGSELGEFPYLKR